MCDGGSGAEDGVSTGGVLKGENGEANKIIFTYVHEYFEVNFWIETIKKKILNQHTIMLIMPVFDLETA